MGSLNKYQHYGLKKASTTNLAIAWAPWCLGGKGRMDPHSSPYIIPNNDPYYPFPHSLLSTRENKP